MRTTTYPISMFNQLILVLLVFCSLNLQAQKTNSSLYVHHIKLNDTELSELDFEDVEAFFTDSSVQTYQKKSVQVLRTESNLFEVDSLSSRLIRFDIKSELILLSLGRNKIRIGESVEGLAKSYRQNFEKYKKYQSFVLPVYHESNKVIGSLYLKYDEKSMLASLHYFAKSH